MGTLVVALDENRGDTVCSPKERAWRRGGLLSLNREKGGERGGEEEEVLPPGTLVCTRQLDMQ